MVAYNKTKGGVYWVYLLNNTTNNRTYLGITNHPIRRLRQHNGELVGGARYTKMFKRDGQWVYRKRIQFGTKREALSFERTAKNIQKRPGRYRDLVNMAACSHRTPTGRREYLMDCLLKSDKFSGGFESV